MRPAQDAHAPSVQETLTSATTTLRLASLSSSQATISRADDDLPDDNDDDTTAAHLQCLTCIFSATSDAQSPSDLGDTAPDVEECSKLGVLRSELLVAHKQVRRPLIPSLPAGRAWTRSRNSLFSSSTVSTTIFLRTYMPKSTGISSGDAAPTRRGASTTTIMHPLLRNTSGSWSRRRRRQKRSEPSCRTRNISRNIGSTATSGALAGQPATFTKRSTRTSTNCTTLALRILRIATPSRRLHFGRSLTQLQARGHVSRGYGRRNRGRHRFHGRHARRRSPPRQSRRCARLTKRNVQGRVIRNSLVVKILSGDKVCRQIST